MSTAAIIAACEGDLDRQKAACVLGGDKAVEVTAG